MADDDLIERAPSDLGRIPGNPHGMLPWEKGGHALLDVLATHEIGHTEE